LGGEATRAAASEKKGRRKKEPILKVFREKQGSMYRAVKTPIRNRKRGKAAEGFSIA